MKHQRQLRSPVRILEAALHLIEDKTRWTTNTLARDTHGCQVNSRSPEAVKFCAVGAIFAVAAKPATDAARTYLAEAAATILRVKTTVPTRVNDEGRNRHTNVLKMYGIAIEKAKEAAR